MNRFRLLAMGTALVLALTAPAQQTASGPDENGHGRAGVPAVDQHMKVLSEKLDLTADQQTRIKPIVQEMHDAMKKAMQDQSSSEEERRNDDIRAAQQRADRQVREILNEEQKKKLDQMEQEAHFGQHNERNGAPPSPQR